MFLSNFASGGWGCPPDPHREGSAHGYTRAVPRCQGTSAGRSNLGVRHLAQRPARPSALAFGSQARRVCEQISNCTPFHAKLHTLSCEKISNCTPFQSLCGFFVKRGLCLLSKSKVAHDVRSCNTEHHGHVFFSYQKLVFT